MCSLRLRLIAAYTEKVLLAVWARVANDVEIIAEVADKNSLELRSVGVAPWEPVVDRARQEDAS